MSKTKLLSHSSPVWPVRDMQVALDFYENELGFTINFKWEDPPTYATMSRDDIGIHLALRDDMPNDYKSMSTLFIFAHDIDAIWAEYNSKSTNIVEEIGNRDYGMRDFAIEDPDGHRIVFGRSLNM